MAKLLAVIGCPGSGSTTLATQLALYCTKQKETVSLVFADPVLPPKSYLIRNPKQSSLGTLLSSTDLSEKQILSAMDAVTDSLGVLGYACGDRLHHFPAPSSTTCTTLLKKLSLCSDTVIVDIGSRLEDKLAMTALEQADMVVAVIDGTLKSVAWQAILPVFSHGVTVANQLQSTLTATADFLFPYFPDLQQQMQELQGFALFQNKQFLPTMQLLHQKVNVPKKQLSLTR